MRLVIFGGTGRIGRQLVRSALAQGHDVVSVSRHPGAAAGPAPARGSLTAVAADVYEPATLAEAVAGADAVIFAVGMPGRSTTVVRSAGISAVGRAMRAAGVTRLVAVAPSAAVISPRAPLTRKIALRYIVHKLYRNPFLDVERMELELPHTGLDWSVVRAPTLHDGPADGRYTVVPEGQVRRVRRLSVADFADYVIRHATAGGGRHDVVTVTGSTSRGGAAAPVGSAART